MATHLNFSISKKKLHPKLNFRYSKKYLKTKLYKNKSVTFEVTDKCNLKCIYCRHGDLYNQFYKYKNIENSQDLNINNAKVFLNFMVKKWNNSINKSKEKSIIYINYFSHGGEPLLNFNLIKQITYYTKVIESQLKYKIFEYSTTTNGTLLEKYIDFLVKNNFNLLISLDGDKECNGYRIFKDGRPSYEKVLKNSILIKEKYPEYFKKKVNFATVLHDKNIKEKIFFFFKKKFNKSPNIFALSKSGVKKEKQVEFNKMYRNIEDFINKEKKKFKCDADFMMDIKYKTILKKLLFCKQQAKYSRYIVPGNGCSPIEKNIYITSNCILLPCEKIKSQLHFGYITNKNKIYFKFNEIATNYNKMFEKLSSECKKCYSLKPCNQCMLLIFEEKKYLENDNLKCPSFYNKTKFNYEINDLISFLEKNTKFKL